MKNFSAKVSLNVWLILSLFVQINAETKVQKQGPITYQEIGDAYLSSFGIIEAEKEKPTNAQKKKLDLSVPVLSEHEKKQILFEIMARNSADTHNSDNIGNEALRVVLKDLDIYFGAGQNTQETLINKLNYTTTVFGEVQLAHMLARPQVDIKLSEQRQTLIKEFVNNPALVQQVEQLLLQVKNAESGFFSYWRTNDPVAEQLFKDLYFSKPGLKKLNNNSYALETLTRLGILALLGN